MNPLETLRHHVTGAIERGEGQAITGKPAKLLFPIESPIGAVWFFSDNPFEFNELKGCGFKPSKRNGREVVEACVMSGAVARAEECGFEIHGKARP